MIARIFWAVENGFSKEVFYGVFRPGVDTHGTVWQGLKGTIASGEAVDLEVDFQECQIVFWQGNKRGGPKNRLAPEKTVKTNRPVRVNADKTVTQPAQATILDPSLIEPRVFMTVMQFDNMVRGLLLAGLGKIPEVGGAIAGLLGLIWSEKKQDLIAESEDRMRHWVQGRILDVDRRTLRDTLAGLRSNLEEYHHAKGRKERARWFDISLAACESAMPHFTKAEYTPGSIALATSLATLHLTLLRERVVFGREILEDEDINESFFRETLTKTIQEYQAFIKEAIPKEIAWRKQQFENDQQIHSDSSLILRDKVTRQVHEFRYHGRDVSRPWLQYCVDYLMEQAEGTLARQLHESAYIPSRLWSLLDPTNKDDRPLPLDGVTWNAPLAGLGYMHGNEHNHVHGDSDEEILGSISEVVAWVDGRIMGIQFNAPKKSGKVHGEKKGGQHHVSVPAGALLTRVDTWFDFDLWGIQFQFSDGTKSETIGTPARGGVHQFAELPRHHVTAIRVGRRMQELRCGFTPLPSFYEDVQP